MHYYEVSLGVERHWKSSVFTYKSELLLVRGTLVRVAFGPKKKMGSINKEVTKPSFICKPIDQIYDFKLSESTLDFLNWFKSYYGAEDGQALAQFLPRYLTSKHKKDEFNHKRITTVDPSLSVAQKKAVIEIKSTDKPSVLHGITGSGKTRIYIRLLLEQLRAGKNGILLYPEISLTPQIVGELEKYFPVINVHSKLTDAERSKIWYRVALNSNPVVIVGPRSSLFLPHDNVGIVLIDEAHESSYKQENDIRYSAVYAAAGLAQTHGAKLVLGSATPPISETHHILARSGNLVCLHERAIKTNPSRKVSIVNMRDRDEFTKHPMISNILLNSIRDALNKNEQTLLFINRRGTAKLVSCSSASCDWQAECARCELPLTFHHDIHKLVCHTCGYRENTISLCPVCGSSTKLQSLGSKAIVDDVQKLFPNARIGRYDSDTITDKSFHTNYEDISKGEVDILIGTQQLVKGLDLPKLSTVGIINADLSLHFPDFSSDERTFQLIAQAVGRVGRGHQKASVVLQTSQPNNPVIRYGHEQDWHGFKDFEISKREQHNLPPFMFYLKLLFREKDAEKAEKQATSCMKKLKKIKGITIDGPLPSFYFKRLNHYYVQLHVRSRSRSSLLSCLDSVPKTAIIDLDPLTLL